MDNLNISSENKRDSTKPSSRLQIVRHKSYKRIEVQRHSRRFVPKIYVWLLKLRCLGIGDYISLKEGKGSGEENIRIKKQ